jgi:NAD(P)-dependent dehydrogenase (short-subunit alcohol dehydrogenase family)
MKLQGKTAIVTGAGEGIGRAIALRLASEGADIAIADINTATAGSTASEIKAMGRRALATKVDVTRYNECEEMVRAAIHELGKVDILVNNAGGSARERSSEFRESTEEVWDLVIKKNLYGTRNCCRAVINHMIDRGSGKIVNIASISGLYAFPRVAEYSSAKAAVIAFTKCLAVEVGALGISVNCVAPGITRTPFVLAAYKGYECVLEEAPYRIIKRASEPEEQANAVLFLVSDEAGYIMGQCLAVDGGFKVAAL